MDCIFNVVKLYCFFADSSNRVQLSHTLGSMGATQADKIGKKTPAHRPPNWHNLIRSSDNPGEDLNTETLLSINFSASEVDGVRDCLSWQIKV